MFGENMSSSIRKELEAMDENKLDHKMMVEARLERIKKERRKRNSIYTNLRYYFCYYLKC